MKYFSAAHDLQGATPAIETLTPVVRTSSRERISDRVHDEIASAIRDLRLAPGAMLSETELSLQLGVSRTPVREAISRLVDQGLVTVVSQVGTNVALIDLAEVEEACFVRYALEVAAFRKACLLPNGGVETLREILVRQETAVAAKDAEAFFASDEDLHQEIFRLAGYASVWNLVRRSKIQLDRLRRLIIPDSLNSRDLIDEHTRIVDLLEAADVEAGVELIEVHALHVLKQAPQVRAAHPSLFTS